MLLIMIKCSKVIVVYSTDFLLDVDHFPFYSYLGHLCELLFTEIFHNKGALNSMECHIAMRNCYLSMKTKESWVSQRCVLIYGHLNLISEALDF